MSENANGGSGKAIVLHAAVIAALFALNFVLPDYHHGVLARVLVLAVFAMGYNLLFGYAGLFSLGHAMFFAAGLYGAGLTMYHLGWGVPAAFLAGLAAGVLLSLVIGVLALRTKGVAFMIVTMMFAQVAYLLIYYFGAWTRGDEGLVIQQQARAITLGGIRLDLTDPTARYMAALILFSIVLLIMLAVVRSSLGRVLVAIRENEERTKMLGYDTFANKLDRDGRFRRDLRGGGRRLCHLVRLCRLDASLGAVFHPAAALGAARGRGDDAGAAHRHAVHVLRRRHHQRLHFGLHADRRRRAHPAGALFPRGILGTIRERWARWLP